MKKLFARALFVVGTTLILSSTGITDTNNSAISVSDAWARATPPGATTAAGFMQLTNPTDQADRLVGYTTEISATPEIHTHQHVDGVMKMTKLEDGITIPANGIAVLKPMSDHLMFLDLQSQLAAAETFTVTAHFEKAGDIDIVFNVLSTEEAQSKMESSMDHEKMQSMDHDKMGEMKHDSMEQKTEKAMDMKDDNMKMEKAE